MYVCIRVSVYASICVRTNVRIVMSAIVQSQFHRVYACAGIWFLCTVTFTLLLFVAPTCTRRLKYSYSPTHSLAGPD